MKDEKYPYGFNIYMNSLWQYGVKIGMWNYSVIEYKTKLCFDSWLVYFMIGLSPKEAIHEDLNEQP